MYSHPDSRRKCQLFTFRAAVVTVTSKWAICLLNRLFRRRSQQTLNLRVTGLCERNSPVIGKLTAQRASNAAKCFHSMPPSWLWTYNNAAPQFSFKWDFHRNGISSKATNLKSIFRYFWNHRGSCRFFFFFSSVANTFQAKFNPSVQITVWYILFQEAYIR